MIKWSFWLQWDIMGSNIKNIVGNWMDLMAHKIMAHSTMAMTWFVHEGTKHYFSNIQCFFYYRLEIDAIAVIAEKWRTLPDHSTTTTTAKTTTTTKINLLHVNLKILDDIKVIRHKIWNLLIMWFFFLLFRRANQKKLLKVVPFCG